MTSAVVVGSGPNGLAAGLRLARAGMEVTVLEAADRIGGGTRSAELTVPGVLHDECSGFHPLAVDSAFAKFAGLDRHGLAWANAPVEYAHPLDDGGLAAWRSLDRTVDGMGADGARFRRLMEPIVERFDTITGDFLGPMLRIPSHPVHLARFGVRAAVPATWIARHLRSAAPLWAGAAAHAFHPLTTPLSSAIGVALAASAHLHGWPVAVGGSAAISRAMAAALRAEGAAVETGVEVASLAELGTPDMVLFDTSPRAAVRIAGDRIPVRVRRALSAYRHGPGAFQVAFAVEGGVPWRHEPATGAGTVHLGGDAEEIVATEAMVWRGDMPERPFVLVGQQYLADPSRSNGDVHPVDTYAHVPAGFSGDASEAIRTQIERFAPGFRERVVAERVISTTGISRRNPNYVGGDIVTGANTARQLVFRPRISRDPYSLGAPGLFLCSAATPPGAGAHGMCGWHAAGSALRSLR